MLLRDIWMLYACMIFITLTDTFCTTRSLFFHFYCVLGLWFLWSNFHSCINLSGEFVLDQRRCYKSFFELSASLIKSEIVFLKPETIFCFVSTSLFHSCQLAFRSFMRSYDDYRKCRIKTLFCHKNSVNYAFLYHKIT